MATEIPESFNQEYASNVELLLQQMPSRFRMSVRENSHTGRAAEIVQQLGAMELVDEDNRHGDTDILDPGHDVRWVHPKDKGGAVFLDKNDDIRTLADFTSPYAENGRAAANRAIDRLILNSFFSDTTITGVDQDVIQSWTTFAAANATHQLASGALTRARLAAGLKALRAAEVDLDRERVYMGVTAEEIEDLQLDEQYVSRDYTGNAPLETGSVPPFLGVHFIHSELIPLNAAGKRRCPMWAESGMALGVWNGIETKISERPDKRHLTQVYVRVTAGATRVEEKKIVEIIGA